MSTVIGNSEIAFEESTLKVEFLWQFNGHKFRDYMKFIDRCKREIHSTDEIRFQSGFLGSTNHYMQGHITQEDHNMYVKIYLGKTELPPEFTNHELSSPRVTRKLDEGQSVAGEIITDEMKKRLISRRYFAEEDFESEKDITVYWFFWDATDKAPEDYNCYYHGRNSCGSDCGHRQPITSEAVTNEFKVFNGDTITLQVEIDYCFWDKNKQGMIVSISGEDNGCPVENSAMKNKPAMSTKDFLFSQRFSDLVIQCETKKFNTHRMILASSSLVFAAMFEQPLKEVQEGVVKIDDFEPEVVEEFLRFIYTGDVKVDKYAAELFKIAHKYEVADLKKKCETALMMQVNKNNFLEINVLGKLGNSQKLLDKCYSVFKANRSTLLLTSSDVDKFKDFVLRLTLE